jgi:hypothetical protein
VKKLVVSTICFCAVALFAAGHAATASSIHRHGISIPKHSLLVVLAGFGCNLVNGQLVCGKSGGKKKNSEDDTDDDADEHEDSKKHKKHQDADTDDGLTQCSIQESSGGGGCVKGFKHVCEKLKSGKKCCGCVPDKNAQAPAGGAGPAPVVQICCNANLTGPGNGPVICSTDNTPPSTEAEMRALFEKLYQGKAATTCAPECRSPNGSVAAKYCH